MARLLVDGRVAFEKILKMTGRRYEPVRDLLSVASSDHQRSFLDLIEDIEDEFKKIDKS